MYIACFYYGFILVHYATVCVIEEECGTLPRRYRSLVFFLISQLNFPVDKYPKIFFCFQIQYPIVTADAYENHFLSKRIYLTCIRSIM